MGAATSNADTQAPPSGAPVILHVYAFTNQQLQVPGLGAYHSGVEVFDAEYAFDGSFSNSYSGVYSQKPKFIPPGAQWEYKESLTIGYTQLSKADVKREIDEIKHEFPREGYNPIALNCNHFSNALCKKLAGVGIPDWVNRAANWAGKLGLAPTKESMAKEEEERQKAAGARPAVPSATAGMAKAGPPGSDTYLLNPLINSNNMECLNQEPATPLSNLLPEKKKKKDTALRSDCDAQLLLNLPFKSNVNLTGIAIGGPTDGSGPRTVKLFANHLNMGFDQTESTQPIQVIQLTKSDLETARIVPLKAPACQNVHLLTIFVEDNQGGGDKTTVTAVVLQGRPTATSGILDLSPLPNSAK